MKKHYDFSKAEQGKFFRPAAELDIPIYLDRDVKLFFAKKADKKKMDLKGLVNTILKKEMELLKKID